MKKEEISQAGFASPKTPSGTAEAPQGTAQEAAKQAAQTAQAQLEELKGAARERGSEAVEEIKTAAQSAAREAHEAGRDFVYEQKENLAQKVAKYAEAIRAASERLRSEEGNVLAGPAEKAAEQLERMSSYLHEREPGDFLDDFESFTRRRPEVVFGGFFVVGLAAARFFKASRKRPRHAGSPEPVGLRDRDTFQLSAAAPGSSPASSNRPPSAAAFVPTVPSASSSSPQATATSSIP
jgi:hypothetical protein